MRAFANRILRASGPHANGRGDTAGGAPARLRSPRWRDHDKTDGRITMNARVQPRRFSPTIKVMHWVTAALLLGSYPAAWMIDSAGGSAETTWLLMIHRSCGVLTLLLTGIRLALRQRMLIRPLPRDVPASLRFTSQLCTSSLFVLLILQPLLGLIGSMLYGDHIVVFGLAVLPLLLPANRALGRQIFVAHGVIASLLLATIGVHVTAALYHHFVRKDDVMAGMVPGAQCRARAGDFAPDGTRRPS
jgi:cytochrome b561